MCHKAQLRVCDRIEISILFRENGSRTWRNYYLRVKEFQGHLHLKSVADDGGHFGMSIGTVLKSQSFNDLAWGFWDLGIHHRHIFERWHRDVRFLRGAEVERRDNENNRGKRPTPADVTRYPAGPRWL